MMPLWTSATGADDVRVGVADGRRAMRRPARVGDADVAVQRMRLRSSRGEIVELALGAAPLELAVVDRADAGGIIAAIFEPLEAVEQPLRDVRLADDPDNSAHHAYSGRFPRHPLAEAAGPAGDALLLAALDREAVGLDVLA